MYIRNLDTCCTLELISFRAKSDIVRYLSLRKRQAKFDRETYGDLSRR